MQRGVIITAISFSFSVFSLPFYFFFHQSCVFAKYGCFSLAY